MDMFVSVIAFVAVIIFMIINLALYHKIFSVVYFDLGRGCFSELFFSWLVAMIEVGIIFGIGKFVLGILFKILGFAGIALATILVIALVAFIIWKIVQMVNSKVSEMETNKTDNDFTQRDQKMIERKELEDEVQDFKVSDADVNMESRKEFDIELVEVGSNKIKVIEAICEIMGLGLKEASDYVDSLPKILKSAYKEEANNIKAKLEAEGAKVTLKLSQELGTEPEIQNYSHTIVCAACGKMIDEDAKFCNFCGSKVVKVNMTICTNCKKLLSPNVNFCNYCGERVVREQAVN